MAHVSFDYHVEVDGFFHSVPHGLIREQIDVRATTRTSSCSIEMRALQLTSFAIEAAGTADPDHMPSAHRR